MTNAVVTNTQICCSAGFYGHPTLSERHRTWSLLRDLCQQSALPWTVIGDFNEILQFSEKEGGCIRREGQMQQFRDALSFCDLIDFGYFGSPFTWSRGGVKCRLDRVVGSVSWTNIFPAVGVSNLKPIHGDHVPVLLGAYRSPPPPADQRRRPRFRFESFWVRHEACVEVIKSGWVSDDQNQPMLQVSQKIMHTRFALNDWQRATFGHRGREIEFLRGRLQSLLALPISAVNQQESMELSSKLDGLLAEEHEYWKQRSKLTWLAEGDRNTKFFHRKASNRRAKNRLTGLFDNHGVWQSTEKGLEAMVIDYFSSMFSAGDVDLSHMFSVVDLVQPKVTPEMNSMLCSPYTDVEIRVALFQMYPTESPGPDGMPPLFFQQYWDTISTDVVAAVQSFLHSGQLLASINYTHVCLIPKVKNPTYMSELRPIALCNVIHKICSKMLANRLKSILSQIISPFQSAFVPGRLITDNTLIANEVSHFIHNNRLSNDGVMSLKLDMSKAYDRMEWVFLETVLIRLGFDESWIHVIMQCVKTVRYSFLINGQPRGYLTPTRGLRQGDPLSPYLFLLGTEVFSALLEHKVSQGQLQGVQICAEAPTIHHLLFTDDSLLFGKASLEESSQIQDVLVDYELASGQKVNFSKSNIVFSKKVCSSLQQQIADSLGVAIVDKHEKYLGLPTYLGRNKTETFAYLQESLNKKLEGWQGKLLSSAGKDLLIRVVAQALPSYTMSCFLLPKNCCDSLHQKCAKFWWGSKGENRKIHWLSWDRLCQPKEASGMSFRDLYAHNLALLAQQGWRLVRNPGSLLAQLYQAKYFPNGDFWSSELSSSPSACWRGIHAAKHILRRGVRWQVGNGRLIRPWEDPWIPRPSSFLPIIRHEVGPERVSALLLPGFSWNLALINQYFVADDVDLILSMPLSQRDVPDRLTWHYDKKGRFSTKSAYVLAFEELHNFGEVATSSKGLSFFWKQIWFAQIPGKVKVHWWKFQIRSYDMLFQSTLATPRSTALRGRVVWLPPPSGWLKANCDGAFDFSSKLGGLGVVIRDAMGDIVGGVCITVNSVTSPDIVEAMACRAACSLAVQFHLSPIMFETDCQSLVSTIEAEGEKTSSLGRIIEDINFSLGILVGSSLRHVYREANMAAHNLAKLALHSSFNLSWSGLVPPDIRGFVASHCTL
ncbi:uncharacterized protein LOC112199282 [Rosa chinensis]|uniref:uncharacterized protein LOC112199282 n=1 Tax=Rosa chinensis TaxID=74649 RepID=UPI000D08ED8E|nr:uncharacterized protein LOC112199282 [Rosa chinensis]